MAGRVSAALSWDLDEARDFRCMASMPIEIILEDQRWAGLGLAVLAERAIPAVLRDRGFDIGDCEISLMGCDDARIAALNAEYRDKPAPTNVLSWPAQDLAADAPGADPDPPVPDFTGEIALGDIALAWETCEREARSANKPLADHVMHLLVHGTLHLLGYDHVRDPDATLMEGLETRILGILGIDDPYREGEGP